MADVESRFIAFENDHTYLKTTYSTKKDIQLFQTSVSTVGSNNEKVVLSESQSSKKQSNIIGETTGCNNDETIPSTVNIPNINLFYLPESIQFALASNQNISQIKMPVQKVNIRYKSNIRPIKPKILNKKIDPVVNSQSNVLPIPSSNNSLNTELFNKFLLLLWNANGTPQSEVTPHFLVRPALPNYKTLSRQHLHKNSTVKPKTSIVPEDKPVIEPIKPMKNKIANDSENGVCTIKLSSNLLKRIQCGEKLFMCMECDKIYTEHKDLLDHQIVHDNCDKQIIVNKMEKRENTFVNNIKSEKLTKHEKNDNDNNSVKEIKPIFKPIVNPKKRKVIFQGECILCHSVFPDLGNHIRTVHQSDINKNKVNNLNYNCYKCGMEFDVKQQLRAHEMAAHKPVYTYTCEHCFEDFSFREDLEKHIEIHYGDSMKYLCPYCDAGFPHSNGLRTHLVKHIGFGSPENSAAEIPTTQIEYSPTRPPEQFDQLFAELDNISEDADEIYVEQVADESYQVRFTKDDEDNILSPLDKLIDENQKIITELNKTSLEDNDKITTNQQRSTLSTKTRISYTVCRICMTIVSYSKIGKHMKKKHNNAAPYQCEICHAEFNRKHIMDDHRRKHTNNKPHKCVKCSKCFTYKHHVNRHMMIVHNADSLEKRFKCSVCDKAFSFKEYLTLHINSRHKGKHYMCQICGKNFSTNATLTKHQLCHTDERPFMCEHCGRTFKCKTHCDTHKKNIHLGHQQPVLPPEKFECSLCNKQFSTKVYRDMHFKRHNGQGHQCDICYKLFVSKAHMKRHIKIMHRN